jgi:hypothetical protein
VDVEDDTDRYLASKSLVEKQEREKGRDFSCSLSCVNMYDMHVSLALKKTTAKRESENDTSLLVVQEKRTYGETSC